MFRIVWRGRVAVFILWLRVGGEVVDIRVSGEEGWGGEVEERRG